MEESGLSNKDPFTLKFKHDPLLGNPNSIGYKTVQPSKREQEELEERASDEVGFIGGISHSWLGTIVKKDFNTDWGATFRGERYVPTDEEMYKALDELNWDIDAYGNALKGSATKEEFENFLRINKERKEYRKLQGSADILDNLASGIGETVADPLTYVPMTGGAGFAGMAGRILVGTASGVSSGIMDWVASGEDPEILTNALMGAAVGGAFELATSRTSRAATKKIFNQVADYSRVQGARMNEFLTENPLTKNAWEKTKQGYAWIGEKRAITVQGAIDLAEGTPLGDIWKALTKSERGFYREATEDGIHRQYGSELPTFTEDMEVHRKLGFVFHDKAGDAIDKFLKTHPDVDISDITHEVRKFREGMGSKYAEDPLFKEIVANTEGFYEYFAKQLISRGMIDGAVDPRSYEHRSYSASAVDDFVDSFGDATMSWEQKKQLAQQYMEGNLVNGALNHEATRNAFKRIYEEEVVKPWEEAKKAVDAKNQKSLGSVYNEAVKRVNSEFSAGKKLIEKEERDAYNKTRVANTKEYRSKLDKGLRAIDKEEKEALQNLYAEVDAKANAAYKKLLETHKKNKLKSSIKRSPIRENDLDKEFSKKVQRSNEKYNAMYSRKHQELKKKFQNKRDKLKKDLQKEREAKRVKADKLRQKNADKRTKELKKKLFKNVVPNDEEATGFTLEAYPDEPMSFEDFVKAKAHDYAYGVLDRNEAKKRRLIDDPANNAYGNDYQQSRMPWNTAYEDERGWSVDRLQSDLLTTMHGYNIKASADLGLNTRFGTKSWDEFQDMMDTELKDTLNYNPDKKFKDQQTKAFQAFFNAIYCRTGLDSVETPGLGAALFEVMRNLTFFAKNGLMGAMNYTEVAEALKAFGASVVIKSLPGVGALCRKVLQNGLDQDGFDYVNNMFFGREVRARGIWREINDKNLHKYGGNRFLAGIVSGSEFLATNSPMTKFLNYTQSSIVNECRGQFIGDLVRMGKKKKGGKKNIFDDKIALQRMNISRATFNKVTNALSKATSLSKNGRIRIKEDKWKELIENDPEVAHALRRMGDYVASEVIQRNDFTDVFLSQGARKSPFINSLLQFKTFAIRSWNKRLCKSVLRAKEGDYAGQAQTLMLSGALGYLNLVMTTGGVTSGMTDEQKRNYLKKTFGVNDLSELEVSDIPNLAFQGLMRSGIMAFPSLIMNMVGYNPTIKTTVDMDYNSQDKPGITKDPAKTILQNMPMYTTAKGYYDFVPMVVDALNVHMSQSPENYSKKDREKLSARAQRDLRAILPNVPFVRDYLINIALDNE